MVSEESRESWASDTATQFMYRATGAHFSWLQETCGVASRAALMTLGTYMSLPLSPALRGDFIACGEYAPASTLLTHQKTGLTPVAGKGSGQQGQFKMLSPSVCLDTLEGKCGKERILEASLLGRCSLLWAG